MDKIAGAQRFLVVSELVKYGDIQPPKNVPALLMKDIHIFKNEVKYRNKYKLAQGTKHTIKHFESEFKLKLNGLHRS